METITIKSRSNKIFLAEALFKAKLLESKSQALRYIKMGFVKVNSKLKAGMENYVVTEDIQYYIKRNTSIKIIVGKEEPVRIDFI